jgi:RNA polymerase sigma-70 factor (ECF subfamily)
MARVTDSNPAFPRAYLRFVAPIRAKSLRLLGSSAEAEEITQETFLRLWQAGPELPPAGDVRVVMAWLYRTCTHLSIDALRKRRRTGSMLQSDDALDTLPCAVSLEHALSARRTIYALHASVPYEELEAVVLCRVDGLAHLEAAELLSISERSLRRLLARFDERSQQLRKETAS